MGCDRKAIEASGAIYASSLDDCAIQCLKLIGVDYPLTTEEELTALAAEEVKKYAPEQKYLRGLYTGGTYMDEAANAMIPRIGTIYSNCPIRSDWKLEDSYVSRENTCVDYGEEEFTLGRPHPAIAPGIRKPAILKEAMDKQERQLREAGVIVCQTNYRAAVLASEIIRQIKEG